MKKIYLMATLLGATSLAFGQVQTKVAASKKISTAPAKTITTAGAEKSLDGVVWHEDFENITTYDAAGDPTVVSSTGFWTVDGGTTASTFGWQIGTTDYSWAGVGDAFTSTSGGAYAQVNNGDPDDDSQQLGVDYTVTSNSIDLSGLVSSPNLILTFEQFGALFYDHQYVSISTDGGSSWTKIYNNDNKEMLTSTGGDYYPNPEIIQVDIESYLTGTSMDQIQLRFGWTSRFAAETNPNAWVTYGWAIDDIKFIEKSEFDLVHLSSGWHFDHFQYSIIPQGQAESMELSAYSLVYNQGTSELTDVVLNLMMDGNVIASSTPMTLAAGATDSLYTTYVLTDDLGDRTITYELALAEEDENPGNNVISKEIKLKVSEDKFAIDRYDFGATPFEYEMQLELTSGPSVFNEVGVSYDIYETMEVTAVDVKFFKGAGEGEVVVGIIDYETGDVIGETEPRELLASEVGMANVFSGVFETPLTLVGGKTYIAYVSTFSNTDISLVSSGETDFPAQILFDVLSSEPLIITNYYDMPYIRLNTDETVSIKENKMNELGITQYPNPFSNETTVKFTLKDASEVSYTVVDVTGKVVANVTEGQMMAGVNEITIDGSSFANGVYYLNLTAGNSNVTHKMVVNK